MVLGFAKSILVARYLGPALLGKYALISLFIEYFSYYNLGVYSSMTKEASIHYGDPKKKTYINNLFSSSLTFSTLLLIPFSCLLISIVWFFPNEVPSELSEYLHIIIALVFFVQVRWFFLRYFRIIENYKIIISFEIISNLILLLGVIFFVKNFLLDGLLHLLLLSNVVIFILCISSFRKNFSFYFDLKLIKKLIIIGFPIMLFTLGEKLFTSVDRIMIASYFTISDLGHYQLGKTFAYGVLMSLDAALFIFYPKILKFFNFKKNSLSKQKNENKLMSISVYFDIFTMPIIILGIIILPIIIHFILPQYSESVFIMRILLLAYGFQNFAFTPSSYLVSNGQQNKLVIIVIISLALMIISNLVAINLNMGVPGILCATSIVFFINSLLMYYACFLSIRIKIIKNLFLVFFRRVILFIISLIIIFLNQNILMILPFYFLIYGPISFRYTDKIIKILKTDGSI